MVGGAVFHRTISMYTMPANHGAVNHRTSYGKHYICFSM